MSDLSVQKSLRMFFSSASSLDEDNQGRSLLPRNLREFAGIKKDIVFIGVGNRAELWARERYDEYMNGKVTKEFDFDKIFMELEKYGV
jgi:MraZ protein